MDVKEISYNQPSFNGYLSKNFTNYINSQVKNEVDLCVKYANTSGIKVNEQEISNITALGKKIINRFTKYLSKTNKDTSLDYTGEYLEFINPLKKDTGLSVLFSPGDTYIGNYGIVLGIEKPAYSDVANNHYGLKALDIISKELISINPKDIDRAFLESASKFLKLLASEATGFFDKFKAKQFAKKIDKFAAQIGEEQTAKSDVEKYLKKAKIEKNLRKNRIRYQKELEDNNQKIANEILKNY